MRWAESNRVGIFFGFGRRLKRAVIAWKDLFWAECTGFECGGESGDLPNWDSVFISVWLLKIASGIIRLTCKERKVPSS